MVKNRETYCQPFRQRAIEIIHAFFPDEDELSEILKQSYGTLGSVSDLGDSQIRDFFIEHLGPRTTSEPLEARIAFLDIGAQFTEKHFGKMLRYKAKGENMETIAARTIRAFRSKLNVMHDDGTEEPLDVRHILADIYSKDQNYSKEAHRPKDLRNFLRDLSGVERVDLKFVDRHDDTYHASLIREDLLPRLGAKKPQGQDGYLLAVPYVVRSGIVTLSSKTNGSRSHIPEPESLPTKARACSLDAKPEFYRTSSVMLKPYRR